MDNKLHVLIVEDTPSDAKLAERELETVLDDFQVQVVGAKEDFLQALKTFKPDLILSDYQLPAFDGLCALQLTREKSPFTPFIILTGSANEDTAVECMKAGADDYVIKEHIKRLGAAVLSALEKKRNEQERHQAMADLLRSEKLNRSITQTAAEAIISLSSDGIVLSWNSAAEKIFGYTSSEMMHKDISEIIPLCYKSGHRAGLERLKNGGKEKLIGRTIELTAKIYLPAIDKKVAAKDKAAGDGIYDGDETILLVDVVMPNMSGRQLVGEMGAFHPETKICYMSGYTEDAIVQHGVLRKGVQLLQKPFSLQGLARKVRTVLDSA